MDDYNDPIHLERISTLNTFMVRDLGAIPAGSQSYNYTTDFYKINDWYKSWVGHAWKYIIKIIYSVHV